MKSSSVDTLIVGAGPIGISCAISAKRAGRNPLVVEAGAVTHSIVRYPIGMRFFTTPELLEIGGHPFPCAGEKPSREEALRYYRGVVRTEELEVATYTRFIHAERTGDRLKCLLEDRSGEHAMECRTLVLAIGYFDLPRLLGVPGEDLDHVSHIYDEGHRWYRRPVVVVGAKNSAVEAALDLFRCGADVTLIHRGQDLGPTVKYWMRPDLKNRIQAGEVRALFETTVESIEPSRVLVRNKTGEKGSVPADRVFLLTGYVPDLDLFARLGIELVGEDRRPRVDPQTLETNVPGIHIVGSPLGGTRVSDIFIENGRFDGERVFGRDR